MKNQKKQIQNLNKAWKMMKEALLLTKKAFPKDKDIEYFIWKLGKINDTMQQYIYKKLQTKVIDEQFKNIIKEIDKK